MHTRREETKSEQMFSKVLLTPYPRRGAVNAREFPLNEQKKLALPSALDVFYNRK